MLLYILPLLLLVRLGIGFPAQDFDAAVIPLHVIADHLHATQHLNWTAGNIEGTQTNFIMAKADMEIWNDAAAAVAMSTPSPTGHITPQARRRRLKFDYDAWCRKDQDVVEVTSEVMMIHVQYLQDYVRENQGTWTATWAMDHPTDPDMTLNYHMSVHDWNGATQDGVVATAFEFLAESDCGRGGSGAAWWYGQKRVVIQIEFYATSI